MRAPQLVLGGFRNVRPMTRTLVISDLHIGRRAALSVLERPAPLALLLDELENVDRLVLLGDIVEMIEARPRSAMTAAEPILRAIGARLGADRGIVFVPETMTER